jgi:hypothetical protein
MSAVSLVTWNTVDKGDNGHAWNFGGTPAAAMRAPNDGNYAQGVITNGQADMNSLTGSDWRNADGSVFSWANKNLTAADFYIFVNNQSSSSTVGISMYLADTPQTWYLNPYNGQINFAINTPQWWMFYNGNDPRVLAALKANNLVVTCIVYNHGYQSQVVFSADSYQVNTTYTDLYKSIPMWEV